MMFSKPLNDLICKQDSKAPNAKAAETTTTSVNQKQEKAQVSSNSASESKSQPTSTSSVEDQEKQKRIKLVEKAKMDIERFLQLSGQNENTDKLIRETNIMKHFDDFILGSLPQATFAKHL